MAKQSVRTTRSSDLQTTQTASSKPTKTARWEESGRALASGPSFDFASLPILPAEEPDRTELPHRQSIQSSFGAEHDLSRVQAQVGGSAAAAVQASGAQAFTRGEQVRFASEPSLHLAAHEAAHVIQQRHGGAPEGQTARMERHADAVAAQVVAGRSAGPLLARLPRNPPVVQTQFKKKNPKPAAEPARPDEGDDPNVSDERQDRRDEVLAKAQQIVYAAYRSILGPTPPATLTVDQLQRVHYVRADKYQDRAAASAGNNRRMDYNEYLAAHRGGLADALESLIPSAPSPGLSAEDPETEISRPTAEDRQLVEKTLAVTDRSTNEILLRAAADSDPGSLLIVLMHELLHTLQKWVLDIFPKELNEATVQLLTLGALKNEATLSRRMVDINVSYVEEVKTFFDMLEKVYGAVPRDDLGRAYLTNDITKLQDAINRRMGLANPATNEERLVGWRILLLGFTSTWSWRWHEVDLRRSDSAQAPKQTLGDLLDGKKRIARVENSKFSAQKYHLEIVDNRPVSQPQKSPSLFRGIYTRIFGKGES